MQHPVFMSQSYLSVHKGCNDEDKRQSGLRLLSVYVYPEQRITTFLYRRKQSTRSESTEKPENSRYAVFQRARLDEVSYVNKRVRHSNHIVVYSGLSNTVPQRAISCLW